MAKFMKLRYSEEDADSIFEVIVSLDLSIFTNINQLVEKISPGENMILTRRAITHKDKVYCVESGQKFKLLEAIKVQGDKADSSKRVPYSDEISIAVRN